MSEDENALEFMINTNLYSNYWVTRGFSKNLLIRSLVIYLTYVLLQAKLHMKMEVHTAFLNLHLLWF